MTIDPARILCEGEALVIVAASDGMQEALGYDPTGIPFEEAFANDDDEYLRAVREALTTETPRLAPYALRGRDGIVHAEPFIHEGRIAGVVSKWTPYGLHA